MKATIVNLVRRAYENFNDAEILAEVGREFEERTRFDLARLFLNRCIELAPADYPVAYINLAFTWFRDSTVNGDDQGLSILEQGIKHSNNNLLRAVYASYLPDEHEELRNDILNEVEAKVLGATNGHRYKEDLVPTLASFRLNYHSPDSALEVLGDVNGLYQRLLTSTDDNAISDLAIVCIRMSLQNKFDINTLNVDALFERLFELHPYHFRGHSTATFGYRLLGRHNDVIRAALRCLDYLPDEESTMLNIALAYIAKEDNLNAEKWCLRAIGCKPSFSGARIHLARMYEKVGRIEEALELVREMVKANPEYPFGYIQAGVMLNKHGHTEEARTLIAQAKPRLLPWMWNSVNANAEVKALVDSAA